MHIMNTPARVDDGGQMDGLAAISRLDLLDQEPPPRAISTTHEGHHPLLKSASRVVATM